MLSNNEKQRYMRHFSLPDIGIEGQQRLAGSKVLCVGAGGLGCAVSMLLAAAGVGSIGLVDEDTIELSNLQRQLLYTEEDIGKSKVEVAQVRLQEINPHVNVDIYFVNVDHDNALDILSCYDIIIDCTDNYRARYLINDACYFLKKPDVWGAVYQFEGQCAVFNGDNCYRCLYPSAPPPGLISDCKSAGVLGVLPTIVGGWQASEAIKLLLNFGETLSKKLLTFDLSNNSINKLSLSKNKKCPLCSHQSTFKQLWPDVSVEQANTTPLITAGELSSILERGAQAMQLIDVRDQYEHDAFNMGGDCMPLSHLSEASNMLDKNLLTVVYCESGNRSATACDLLLKTGFSKVQSLEGGVKAWQKGGYHDVS